MTERVYRWDDTSLAELPVKGGFRIRGGDMTRLETFTDAAFAFAVTLLVISVDDVPSSYEEFVQALKSVPAFIACFLQLIMFWLGHRRWSELYGLDDARSVWLSFILIMGVLVLVYPLRVMYSMAFAYVTDYWLPAPFQLEYEFVPNIFVFYSAAFAILSASIVGLYLNAWRQRERLALNDVELMMTRSEIQAWLILTGTGIVSCAVALLVSPEWSPLAGWIYAWLGLAMPLHARREQRLRDKLLAAP